MSKITIIIITIIIIIITAEVSSCGVVANVLNCKIVVNEFELQSCSYVQFRTNTFGKGMNLPAMD